MSIRDVIRDPSPEGAREIMEFSVPEELHGAIGLDNANDAMNYIFDTVEDLLIAGIEVVKEVHLDRIYEMLANIMGAAFA